MKKYFSPRLILIALGALALLAAGCAKKPVRPDPSATMYGQPGGVPGTTGGDLNTQYAGEFPNRNTPVFADPAVLDPRPATPAAPVNADQKGLFGDVYFDFDQSAIKAGERSKLQAAKDYLVQHQTARVRLEGHCDWRGTAEYNLALGDRRANSAKRYLTSIGVAAARIDTVSHGSLNAIEKGTAAEMSKDRRVEIIVLAQ
ncbi:MAG: OmpA family protein [Opitutaceae bacterium]|nr:OmpA family protein [Opitutaceae bacterium]